MEIIKEVNKGDINSSLMRLNKDIKKNTSYYNKVVNDAYISMEEKYEIALEYHKKLLNYKKVLIVLDGLINKYCNDNNISIYTLVHKQWADKYQSDFFCRTSDSIPHYTFNSAKNDIESTKEYTSTCNTCNTCQTCNNSQDSCDTSYYEAVTSV